MAAVSASGTLAGGKGPTPSICGQGTPHAPARIWRDGEGNTYTVEKAVRTGHWMAIRTNAGGNRHGYKPVGAFRRREDTQALLDKAAEVGGWKEVTG